MNFDISGFHADFIPGNKSRNTVRGRHSGGLAVYYKNYLKNYISIVKKEQSGILWIKLSEELFPFDHDVFMCNIYVPPTDSKVFSSTNIDLYDQLEQDVIHFNNLGKVFVSGDLNGRTSNDLDYFEIDKYIDHNTLFDHSFDIPVRVNQDRIADYNGRHLLDMYQLTGLLIANGRLSNDRNMGKYTFCGHRGQSTVDYLLLNFQDFELLSHFEVKEFNEYSDHAPLLFHIRLKSRFDQETRHTDTGIIRKIVWDNTKVQDFKSSLMNKYNCIQQMTSDIDNEPLQDVINNFTQFLHDEAFEIFGKTYNAGKRSQGTKLNKQWFDENCRDSKHEFTTARNIFNRVKNDQSRISFTRARTKYNRVKKKAREKFKRSEGNRLNELAKTDARKFWKSIKNTYKKKNITQNSIAVDELHDHFKRMFGEQPEPNQNTEPNVNMNIINAELDEQFTYSELHSAIFSQNNNKTPGIDSITSEIIKASYDITCPFLLKLYNYMYETGQYPRSWGESIISPIFKKGDTNDAQNYRGISLINILAKIYSQLLLNRLTKWTSKHEIIMDNQYGFQKGKSTTDCVFLLHSVISKVLNSGEKLYCIFIDYEKCFDKIDRSHLWQKLLAENISSKLVTAIKSMYATVKLCVTYNNTFSPFFESYIGLKQGDPSSPLLFMLFVNDMLQHVNSNLDGIFTLDDIKLFLILFADDQVVFAKTPQTLQLLLKDIENYCNELGIHINTSKTKAMIFEKGRYYSYEEFFIYNSKIELVNSFKYLGITLFKNGNWYRSQKSIAQHASRALYNLFSVFDNIELPASQKCKLFDSLVGSILNFGAELWGTHEATDIELVHTKFLRRVLKVKKSTNLAALYGELGRVPLVVYRKVIMIKYWIRILNHNDSSLVKKMYMLLKSDTDQNNDNGKNWVSQIKHILQLHGLEFIWNQQFQIEIPFSIIKQRIFDMYYQKWYSEINNSSRLMSYCIFKHEFVPEKYLSLQFENKYKVALTRFRVSSHDLFIETGRYENPTIERTQRLCKSCNMKQIEDEFHFLLVCPKYRELRRKYLKPYFCHWPTLRKFDNLMSSTTYKTVLNLSKFIYYAMKIRNV